ncbi:MAG TPA: leucine zipper domain-containing protein [Gemmatimonadaceae bacterium]
MSELCARYGVSRRIGYKWLERYHEEGRRGLQNRSRKPHNVPIASMRASPSCAVSFAAPIRSGAPASC